MEIILAFILSLAHEEATKTKALSLFNMMAPKLGKNYCHLYIVYEVASMAGETDYALRKSVCENFIKICQTIDPEVF